MNERSINRLKTSDFNWSAYNEFKDLLYHISDVLFSVKEDTDDEFKNAIDAMIKRLQAIADDLAMLRAQYVKRQKERGV